MRPKTRPHFILMASCAALLTGPALAQAPAQGGAR